MQKIKQNKSNGIALEIWYIINFPSTNWKKNKNESEMKIVVEFE